MGLAIDSKTQKTIRLTANSDQIDMQTLRMTVSGAELIASTYKPIDSKSGDLQLALDPKLGNADTIQSELHTEMQLKGVPNSLDTIMLHFTHRTTVIPKTPIFASHGTEFRSTFIVRSAGLIDALVDQQILELFAIEGKGDNATRVPLIVDTPLAFACPLQTIIKLDNQHQATGFLPSSLPTFRDHRIIEIALNLTKPLRFLPLAPF